MPGHTIEDRINTVLNFAPHQSWLINVPIGVNYYSINHLGDFLSENQMHNTTAFTSNAAKEDPHFNSTF